jgi:hypothetical protein
MRARGSLLLALFIVRGKKGCALVLILLLLRGREGGGVQVYVFFSPSFDIWKEEGKRVSFFSKLFFHC